MKAFWNTIYYFVYRADYKFHIAFRFVNPFYFLNLMPFAKKQSKKKGVNDLNGEIDKVFENPANGISTYRAGLFMHLLVIIFFAILNNFFDAIVKDMPTTSFIVFMASGFIASISLNYFLSNRKSQYLLYFSKIKKWPKKRRVYGSILTLFFVLFVFALLVLSFHVMTLRFQGEL
ncbi:MAG: hypothetical protein A2W93_09745 [Bacteroidetes bacterium GWF2_43_63]|nr:MAG: hypothetical protein A2W94_00170 [Bacteroidetes bacterium GWE2_42_42]OFY56139.1 MAG: hypothetical protein A2W93_09745 [Bacteroidetes bacterium GWF2_43_63]HBG69769.1 hypothetical protein [Bacteroidales bacterium]HCB61145.1 hypothetical protein [Bacteroidales bacterium]HCY24059.1 hypothetical protein [Bacteroidales bacterium]